MAILDGITPEELNKEYNEIHERLELVANRAEFIELLNDFTDRELAVYIANDTMRHGMAFEYAVGNGNAWLEHREQAIVAYGSQGRLK